MAILDQYGKEITAKRFGYNASVSTDRRQAPRRNTAPEDTILPAHKRTALIETSRDIQRNTTILQYVVQKHIGYMSDYVFFCQTESDKVNKIVEKLITRYSKAINCDVSKRHSLDAIVAIAEGRRLSDGDVFIHFTSNGKLQIIESDRVAKPSSWPLTMTAEDTILAGRTSQHGLVLDQYGAIEAICVCRYDDSNAIVFDRFISGDYIEQLGYFTRYNQSRGISPLAGALNASQDLGELTEYVLAKIKADARQGYSIYRQSSDPIDTDLLDSTGLGTTDPALAVAESSPTTYEVPSGVGPFLYDLDPGDKVELLASASPNANLQQFLEHIQRQIIAAVEMPDCLYDSSRANYKSYVAARYDYNATIARKRKPLTALLDRITDWRIKYWATFDQELVDAMKADNISLAELMDYAEWIPLDLPPVSRLEDAKADAYEISMALNSRSRLSRKRGLRVEDNMADLAKEQRLSEKLNIVLATGLQPGAISVEEATANAEDNTQ